MFRLLIVVVALIAGVTFASDSVFDKSGLESQLAPAITLERQTVQRVVDGDTLTLASGVRVRMIGVDTPESVSRNSPVECYGPEASAYTKALLPAGTSIVLQEDVGSTDRYGRKLAYVYRASDNLFVNAELLKTGHASVLTIKPNVAHQSEFTALERAAKTEKVGLWGAC